MMRERIGVIGLAATGVLLGFSGLSWLVGTLGVSAAVATSIATAVEVGSWAMFLVAIAATGGLVGAALWGALKLLMWRAGKKAVIA